MQFKNADDYFDYQIEQATLHCPANLIKEIQEDYIQASLWENLIPEWRKTDIDLFRKNMYVDNVGIIRLRSTHTTLVVRNHTVKVLTNTSRRISVTPGTLAWILHHGQYPPLTLIVDHIVADSLSDNRKENLRLVTPQLNAYSTSGSAGGLRMHGKTLAIEGKIKPTQLCFISTHFKSVSSFNKHMNAMSYRIALDKKQTNNVIIQQLQKIHELAWGRYSIFNLPTTVPNMEKKLNALRTTNAMFAG